MKYQNYSYIYPPRPRNSVPPRDISKWDNKMMLAQPKLNGSNCVIFLNEENLVVMNRHGQRLTNFQLSKSEITKLHSGSGWMVLNGEYLNKSKRDETGLVFNHKFVIFDVLVYNGQHLVGKTFQERVNLLDELFDQKESEKNYLYNISENIYRVKSYYDNFNELFEDFIKIDMIEGLVCKRTTAKLELGISENNNFKSQVKFRKPTKNYSF
jgi:ATP-dependent DNA ligase